MKAMHLKGHVIDDIISIGDKRVILFPAGKYTHMLLQFKRPANIAYICDNNPDLHGTSIYGIPVVSPTQITEETDDCCIIVTSNHLFRSIFEQISKLGVLNRCEFILCNWDYIRAASFYDPFTFEDRRKHFDKTLIILAGYKDKLWDIIFKRIERFVPDNIDVCVMSSGKYVDRLREICENNDWSYLSTVTNNVSLIQNIAIELHPNAQFIYKLDEDMFICEGFFEGLMDTYMDVEANSAYHVGLVAPVIPVNPHGAVRFMELKGCLDEFESRFGKAYYDFYSHFSTNLDETLFLWEQSLPLDVVSKEFQKATYSYYVCPHRFSIGAILFPRLVWEGMGGFKVRVGAGLGSDEYDFAEYFLSMVNFYTYIIAENVLAGHYSFGRIINPEKLDEFYETNRGLFDILETDDLQPES